jgi:hypothetical protein
LTPAHLYLAVTTRLWNALVPAHAKALDAWAETHVRYCHPTKGWRRVSKKRLGLA